VLALASTFACSRENPPRQYALAGQILAVHPEKQELTIKHGDIEDLMPAMTMTFAVASAAMVEGRTPGELIKGTLEIRDSGVRLIALERTGVAPLPSASEVALAAGVLEVGDAVPDAAFIDQHDKRRSFAEWKGTATVVTFVYTECPLETFCPLMGQNFATIQRGIAEDARLKGRVKLVSFTFDPDRDQPAVLTKYAARLKADPAVWTFLTGDRATVEKFAARFGVGLIRSPETPAEITHNLRTYLIGADGRVLRIYSGNQWTPGAVLSDLRSTLGS
jgi:protein SCO1/2